MLCWERVRRFSMAAEASSDSKLVMGVCGRLRRLSAIDSPHTGRGSKRDPNGTSSGGVGFDTAHGGRGAANSDRLGNSSLAFSSPDSIRRLAGGQQDSGSGSRHRGENGGRNATDGPSGILYSRMAQRAHCIISRAGSPQQALAFMAKHAGNDAFYRSLGAAAARRWGPEVKAGLCLRRTFSNIEVGVDGDGDEAAHLMECCLPPAVKSRARDSVAADVTDSLDWYGALGRTDHFLGEDLSTGICVLCGKTWEAWGSARSNNLLLPFSYGERDICVSPTERVVPDL